MLRRFFTALAMLTMLARNCAGWAPVNCCDATPCDWIPIECCDAWTSVAPRAAESLPHPPVPPARRDASTPTAPQMNADAIKPLPLNRPSMQPPAADPTAPESPMMNGTSQPAAANETAAAGDRPAGFAPSEESQPVPAQGPSSTTASDVVTSATEQSGTPAEAPRYGQPAAMPQSPTEAPSASPSNSRYGTPPAAEPAATVATDMEDVFSEGPSAAAPAEGAAPGAAPAAEPADSAKPVTETVPADESPASPPDSGQESVPGEEDLFGPTSSDERLQAPGGWESAYGRTWMLQDGQAAAIGQIAGVTSNAVVLSTDAGHRVELRYRDLSDADLTFVRGQIDARRQQLAALRTHERLFARKR